VSVKRVVLSAFIGCCITGSIVAQEPKYPFPQKVTYPYGVMPTRQDAVSDFAKKWYDNWKRKYLQDDCGGKIRPGVDPLSRSLVEAQGFAMVPIAYMGDKELFDKMYDFYKSKCVSSACGLMDWKVTCNGVEARGAATDGDVDVACALLVAHWQWPEAGYDEKLKALLTNLKKLISSCGDLLVLHPGCGGGSPWGGCNETDISYYTPAFFRYFAKFSGDEQWEKLADDTQVIRDNAANAQTGLVPDWQSVEGRAGAGSRVGYFAYDAIRAPYKQALDFLWHGTNKAEVWAKKLTDWANGVGVKSIVDGYDLNGNRRGSNHNMAVLGSMAVASMANSQDICDKFVDETLTRTDGYWYSGYLGNLYLFALSGNMWNPEIQGETTAKSSRAGSQADALSRSVHASLSANRHLKLSGIPEEGTVLLLTLSGKCVFSAAVKKGDVAFTVPALGRGCYLFRYTALSGLDSGRILPLQ
jgi:endoglucanase